MSEGQSETRRSPIVGIDLGTTMSAICIFENERVEFIANELGEKLTPSVVAHDLRARGLVVGVWFFASQYFGWP